MTIIKMIRLLTLLGILLFSNTYGHQNYSEKETSVEKAKQYLPLFGLDGFEHHLPFTLSGGMRQRANFLRTFLYGKEMLVLDEPFGKLDAITRLQLQKWLMDLRVKTNQTVLLITHDIEEAIYLSDRIYVLSSRPGKIIAEVKVNQPQPRENEFLTSHNFSLLKKELLESLH